MLFNSVLSKKSRPVQAGLFPSNIHVISTFERIIGKTYRRKSKSAGKERRIRRVKLTVRNSSMNLLILACSE